MNKRILLTFSVLLVLVLAFGCLGLGAKTTNKVGNQSNISAQNNMTAQNNITTHNNMNSSKSTEEHNYFKIMGSTKRDWMSDGELTSTYTNETIFLDLENGRYLEYPSDNSEISFLFNNTYYTAGGFLENQPCYINHRENASIFDDEFFSDEDMSGGVLIAVDRLKTLGAEKFEKLISSNSTYLGKNRYKTTVETTVENGNMIFAKYGKYYLVQEYNMTYGYADENNYLKYDFKFDIKPTTKNEFETALNEKIDEAKECEGADGKENPLK